MIGHDLANIQRKMTEGFVAQYLECRTHNLCGTEPKLSLLTMEERELIEKFSNFLDSLQYRLFYGD